MLKTWCCSTTITLRLSGFGTGLTALADTVQARCDVYPKGEDRATSSGLCTFSQRQDFVGIGLKNGKRYDLSPNDQQPDGYTDQNGRPVSRELLEGNRGQLYRSLHPLSVSRGGDSAGA